MLKKAIITIVLSLSIFAVPLTASATPKHHVLVAARVVLSAVVIAEWQRIATCEEGGNWNYFSYWYPDALGIDRPNWIQFGGSVAKPSSRATQIKIGTKFLRAYHMAMPDQQGYCAPW